MIVRYSESRQMTTRARSIDGFMFSIFLQAKENNVFLGMNDFDPRQVNIKVILRRAGRNYTIVQDNMLLLGAFSTLLRGQDEFFFGFYKQVPGTSTKCQNLRYFFLDFGVPLNLKGDDELYTEVTVSKSAFSSNVDESLSYIEYAINPAMAYEVGIPFLFSNVVQSQATKENYNLGDNVLSIAFLNFDRTDWEKPVVNNLQLSSDRFDLSLNFHELMIRNLIHYPAAMNYRFTTSLTPPDEHTGTGKTYKYLPPFPQSCMIFNGGQSSIEVDQCSLDISFDGQQVNASQNYIVCRRLETDVHTIVASQEREVKHINEKLASLPAKLS
ncbi:hypothetical protein [Chitinophaga qingshengii]|uniref:Uncharacterized protein n=1 Tax=Chitinophaga qingshengii TaxID=1569794 RepID=A0ABR7TUJ0_9BACT|nr:hypothetical protein [Chitinophaga qingshengii]MBC9933325.1 hypothetical protein [Chitinophaga qingshengii]